MFNILLIFIKWVLSYMVLCDDAMGSLFIFEDKL